MSIPYPHPDFLIFETNIDVFIASLDEASLCSCAGGMAESTGNNANCLFLRGRDDDPDRMDEMWDDSALIRAYDKAISSVQKKLNIAPNSNSSSRKTQRTKRPGAVWKLGDACQAQFSEDGYYYEACISSVDYSRGKCVVKYAHYGNEEEHNLRDLLSINASLPEQDLSEFEKSTVSSVGRLSVSESASSGNVEKGSSKKKKKRHSGQFAPSSHFPRSEFLPRPVFAPPVASQRGSGGPAASFRMPPLPPQLKPPGDDPALNSMLMSWYMCGYHSGYYQGVTDTKSGNH